MVDNEFKIPGYNDLTFCRNISDGNGGWIYENNDVFVKAFCLSPDNDMVMEVCNISGILSDKISEYVPKVHAVFKTDTFIALVMQKIRGSTLAEFISEHHTARSVQPIVVSLVSAVIALHDAGYAHGDLHQNNIIIENNRAILIDFFETRPIEDISDDISDYIQLRHHIAQLIYPDLPKKICIAETLRLIEDYDVTKVIGYNSDPALAEALFNILMLFKSYYE